MKLSGMSWLELGTPSKLSRDGSIHGYQLHKRPLQVSTVECGT